MLSVENYKKVLPLPLSDEADTGSGGDQPARNILSECNGKGERKFPNPFFLLQSLMPKKTHCFDRNKRKKKTSINPKKSQPISGQDRQRTAIRKCSQTIKN